MVLERVTPDEQHELDVIDAAVRGGAEARPEDAALTEFALLVRSVRPLPDHETSLRMDQRLAPAAARPQRSSRLYGSLAAGLTVVVLLVGVGVIWADRGRLTTTEGLSLNRDTQTQRASAVAAGPAADATTESTEMKSMQFQEQSPTDQLRGGQPLANQLGSATAIKARGPRKVARDARLVLAAPAAGVERLADRVNAIADESGGYVQSAHVTSVGSDRARATFLLMVPARTFQETLARLSRLAHVRSRTQAMSDITAEFNTNERALARARARVVELEKKFEAADDPAAKRAASRELRRATAAERDATRSARVTRSRVSYVPLDLRIAADSAAADADKGTIAKAFARAGRILTSAAAVLIVVLAVAVPLALLCLFAWWGVRRWRRARAEAAIARAAAQPE